ncbi:ankyrin repeat domain-containing protein [Litoribrevibacter euphylliae]|uniref:Ankyrin repeat domain-containing protein n=1 Tax=Litoribrevibacter euphylliae TaxID=1834034 RepID=A0ABV7HJ66_9GAMM
MDAVQTKKTPLWKWVLRIIGLLFLAFVLYAGSWKLYHWYFSYDRAYLMNDDFALKYMKERPNSRFREVTMDTIERVVKRKDYPLACEAIHSRYETDFRADYYLIKDVLEANDETLNACFFGHPQFSGEVSYWGQNGNGYEIEHFIRDGDEQAIQVFLKHGLDINQAFYDFRDNDQFREQVDRSMRPVVRKHHNFNDEILPRFLKYQPEFFPVTAAAQVWNKVSDPERFIRYYYHPKMNAHDPSQDAYAKRFEYKLIDLAVANDMYEVSKTLYNLGASVNSKSSIYYNYPEDIVDARLLSLIQQQLVKDFEISQIMFKQSWTKQEEASFRDFVNKDSTPLELVLEAAVRGGGLNAVRHLIEDRGLAYRWKIDQLLTWSFKAPEPWVTGYLAGLDGGYNNIQSLSEKKRADLMNAVQRLIFKQKYRHAFVFYSTINQWQDIHYLASLNRVDEIKKLIETAPETVDQLTRTGNTPLMIAIEYGASEAANLLLTKSKALNHINEAGLTAYSLAIASLDTETADKLEQHKVKLQGTSGCAVALQVAQSNLSSWEGLVRQVNSRKYSRRSEQVALNEQMRSIMITARLYAEKQKISQCL